MKMITSKTLFLICALLTIFFTPISAAASTSPSHLEIGCKKMQSIRMKNFCKIHHDLDMNLKNNYLSMSSSDIGDGARRDLVDSQKKWDEKVVKCKDDACLVRLFKRRANEICEYPVISGVYPICIVAND